MSDILTDSHKRMEALLREDNARLRAALEAAQWGSCDGCGQHRHCPECGASRLGPDEDANGQQMPGKHKPGCVIGTALGGV